MNRTSPDTYAALSQNLVVLASRKPCFDASIQSQLSIPAGVIPSVQLLQGEISSTKDQQAHTDLRDDHAGDGPLLQAWEFPGMALERRGDYCSDRKGR